MSDDDQAEIVSRPPSHPIATTLLVVSMLGTILSIAIIWSELFSEYLPTPAPGQATSQGTHKSMTIAERHVRDHYKEDFKGSGPNDLVGIEKELGISSSIGGGEEMGGGGEDMGGGDEDG